MKLFIILLTIFILLLMITLGISNYAYRSAFLAPKRKDFRQYTLPEDEQYIVHHPTMKKCIDEMLAVPYEEVYITAFDGTKLFARYYHVQDNAPIHIMFHGYKGNPYLEFCGGSKLIADLNHNALVVDQRSHGKSEGNTITFGIKERRDCLSWIQYCCDRFDNETPILLWGLSMGGATVLMVTDLDLPDNVVGIIADCPYSSPKAIIHKVCSEMPLPPKPIYPFVRLGAFLFGHFNLEESSAVASVKQTKVPILLFHGDDDRLVPCEMSKEIKAACPDRITFELIPQAGHGLCYMVSAQRYEDAILKFIKSVLG